jgi:hypothetical protein
MVFDRFDIIDKTSHCLCVRYRDACTGQEREILPVAGGERQAALPDAWGSTRLGERRRRNATEIIATASIYTAEAIAERRVMRIPIRKLAG